MHAYKALSAEIGQGKLLEHERAGGTEPSHAGKMRTSHRRAAGAHKSWVDAMIGRDYLSEWSRRMPQSLT